MSNIDDRFDDRSDRHTRFAPPGRSDRVTVGRQAETCSRAAFLGRLLDAAGVIGMVLNGQRQVVVSNADLRAAVGAVDAEALAGLRPGEVVGCIHAHEEDGGCGTSESCSQCGAVLAILAAQRGETVSRECLITTRANHHEESLEFAVRASPLEVDGERFTVLTLRDVSGEKRREALEATFFHDVLNTIGGLYGYARLLEQMADEDNRDLVGRISFLGERLRREVEDQRAILSAERGTLELSWERVDPAGVLADAIRVFDGHPVARGRSIESRVATAGRRVLTDRGLLGRVLVNMIKNALEATPEGERVVVGAHADGDDLVCEVRNPGLIPREVALRIFQRSFSTKSAHGRGLGTYGMKLFGERYLGGRVGFRSTEPEQTVFFVRLPWEGPEAPGPIPPAEGVR